MFRVTPIILKRDVIVMDFEPAVLAAERLGCSLRAVQKWAKEGKIEGAKKVGRDWLIPVSAARPGNLTEKESIIDGERVLIGMQLPLLEGDFKPGDALKFINAIGNADDRQLALSEYYYYTGEFEKCSEIAEIYADYHNPAVKFASALLGLCSNIHLHHSHKTQFAVETVVETLERDRVLVAEPEFHASRVFSAWIIETQFHINIHDLPPLENYMRWLPGGHKAYAGYLMAYTATLKKDFGRALGLAEAALAFRPLDYPIATIYLYIIKAVAHMNLMQVELAKQSFKTAWEIAQPNGFIVPFAEHYNLFQGLAEVCLKTTDLKSFQKIQKLVKAYNIGWFSIRSKIAKDTVADNLSLTEFTIAMLYSRNWKAKEISEYLDLSERTIKNHIQVIYEKLGIGSKKELHQFLIK